MATLSPESTKLIELITSATASIEKAYASNNQPLPTLGTDGRTPAASDASASDRGPGTLPSAELVRAIQLLKGATTQLLAQLVPPPLYCAELALSSLDSAAIGVVAKHRVADIIHKHDPDATKGVPISTIAEETGLDSRHLARVIRSLASKHVFLELSPDTFTNSRHAAPLRSDTATSCVHAYTHWVWDVLPSASKLDEGLSDKEHSAAFSVAHSGAARAFGGVFWDFLSREPERGRIFNEAMKEATQHVSISESIFEDVPWQDDFGAKNPKGVFVDVGAGAGHQALSVAPKLPGWEFIIEDLPNVLESSAKELWTTRGSQYNYKLVPQNFFEAQSIKGADVYYMKHIIHDWPDKESVQILKHLRDAADVSRTRLLIADIIIQPALPPTSETEPLLANLGGGASMTHKLDMIMMTLLEAQERTQAEFEENVLGPAGWKLSKVHYIRSHMRFAVLECVPI
ncbi:hypothetical protein A4X13_0g6558 [Tilletia indica]|uniref:O-methyltransferase C-terminal domain-containing protein n=1 Tax=Tilletia indica TaxID=43049 RepID=A0A177TAG9_9BASI|nr:hypothetical protein A4X13_0g6558 [Tilletia indica]